MLFTLQVPVNVQLRMAIRKQGVLVDYDDIANMKTIFRCDALLQKNKYIHQ